MVLEDSLSYQPPKVIKVEHREYLGVGKDFLDRMMDGWIKMWYIHTYILFGHEEEENSVISTI